MSENIELNPQENAPSAPEISKPEVPAPEEVKYNKKLNEDAEPAKIEEGKNPKKIEKLKKKVEEKFAEEGSEDEILKRIMETGETQEGDADKLSVNSKAKLFLSESKTTDPERRKNFLASMRKTYEDLSGEKGLSDEEIESIVKKRIKGELNLPGEAISMKREKRKDKEQGNVEEQEDVGKNGREELDNDSQNESEPQEENEDIEKADEGDETIEGKIKNANSFEELVDILKPIKKGFGFSLKNGGFYRGKFGGEPIVQTISRINEIQRTVMALSPDYSKYFGDYVNNHHISYNLEDVPEESGLKDKVKELLKNQQTINEEETRKSEEQEKRNVSVENGKTAEEYFSVLGLSNDASEKEIKKAYRDLAKQHHPDRNLGNKEAEEKFKKVQEAYDFLANK